MIYFLHDPTSRAVKIGTAEDVERRIAGIKTANPNLLTLLGTLPGGVAEERLLHRQFDYFRIRGEWFKDDPDVIRDIKSILMTEGKPSTIRDENDRRGGCRAGLKGLDVSVLGIVDRFRVHSSQWGAGRTLLLDLYPADQAPPRNVWHGPMTPDIERQLSFGIICLSWVADGRLSEKWPFGSLHKVNADQCVLMSDWPIVCCEPEN